MFTTFTVNNSHHVVVSGSRGNISLNIKCITSVVNITCSIVITVCGGVPFLEVHVQPTTLLQKKSIY